MKLVVVVKKPEGIVGFLKCSSLLEQETYRLYQSLADKVDIPLIKSMLQHIAYDSRKHSAILNGMFESLGGSKINLKDCQKRTGLTWRTIGDLKREISSEKNIPKETLPSLAKKLEVLESNFGEEYFVLVQMKTLEYMTKEINEIYNVQLKDMKEIFEVIIRDEGTHKELLSKMQRFLSKDEKKIEETKPGFKYQNPDAWSKPHPDSVYENAT
jgi:rubrerythrin